MDETTNTDGDLCLKEVHYLSSQDGWRQDDLEVTKTCSFLLVNTLGIQVPSEKVMMLMCLTLLCRLEGPSSF